MYVPVCVNVCVCVCMGAFRNACVCVCMCDSTVCLWAEFVSACARVVLCT